MIRLVLALVIVHAGIAAADPAVTVETLVAQPAIARTVRAKPAELSTAITSAVLGLVVTADQNSLVIVGPPFARYRARGSASIEVEVGVPVRKRPQGKLGKDVRAIDLPAGPAAVVVFRGRREQLPRAHAALDAWLAEHHKQPAGARWEVYVTNPLQTPDPDAQETRVVAPFAE